jgi:hypothetical protein
MPTADLAMGGFLVLCVMQGLRQGISRTLISCFAIVGATWIAFHGYTLLGPTMAARLKVPADMGLALGAAAAWAVGYVVCLLAGWLAWRKIRGKPPEKPKADAGPITKADAALPGRYGVIYWLDKILGAALGVARGAAYLVVFLFICSNNDLGPVGAATRSSATFAFFMTDVRPFIIATPAGKIVHSLGNMRRIGVAVQRDPSKMPRVVNDPALAKVRAYPPLQQVAADPEVQALVKQQKFGDLLRNDKVVALLEDGEFLRLVSDVDYDRILEDLNAPEAPAFIGNDAGPAPGTPGGPPPEPYHRRQPQQGQPQQQPQQQQQQPAPQPTSGGG